MSKNWRNPLRAFLGLGAAAAVSLTAAGLAAGADTASTGSIRHADAETAIAGSYIVVLDDAEVGTSTSAVTRSAASLTSTYGGTVQRTYSAAIDGFEAKLSEREAEALAADPAVAYVEQNARVGLSLAPAPQQVSVQAVQTNPPSWGIDRIDQRNLPLNQRYEYTSTGRGVTVYVIDTGVDINHPTFGGRASYGYDFVNGSPNAADQNGHGTHVAGTVAGSEFGVAKEAEIVAVRVLDAGGSGTTAGVVAGVDWVADNASGPSVSNLSLGGVSTALDQAVAGSIAAGVSSAVAAGNSNANANFFSPARVPTAITVGATTRSDARASYSNWGKVDIFAPGSDITSSWLGGGRYTGNGTSFAAPHVAGAAARYLQSNPNSTPAQVKSALVAEATPNIVGNPGSGSANRLLFKAPAS
ncbi:S8 family peptidase [Actinoalloteichus hymeniacidonis]|uniref:Subtilisin-like serine protease n=1 Tax=Actinoalloteichus hymeniacidonis TaxID=340345 RepID=A0AAC9N0Z1_9PSEU|nr:S8 family peptidase [Actinoalloteichus hymeniacidonis]AOS65880.1 subtilisin-like serine protease [Actinoalloteichus hymeniacidonis]MBB5906026.1 subtilisin family serine protease [Actinoalloteichus hymeniacidonis]